MGQECFYRENRQDRAEEEILLTERLAEGCGETDEGRYQEMILAESVVFPDLKDAALQNSYGVIGAERLLARLLLAGEYDCLRREVERINGGEDDGCTDYI